MNPFRPANQLNFSIVGGPSSIRQWFRRGWKHFEDGERQLELGNNAEAERQLAVAAGEAPGRLVSKGDHIRVLLSLTTAQWRQGKLAHATESAARALEMSENGSQPLPEQPHCRQVLAHLLLESGDHGAARGHLEEAVAAERRQKKPRPEILVHRLLLLARAQRAGSDFTSAEESVDEAMTQAQISTTAGPSLHAEVLSERAALMDALGRQDECTQCLESCVAIHRKLYGPDSEEVAVDYQRLAEHHRAGNNLEAAIQCYERALHIRERQVGEHGAEQAMIRMSLAETQFSSGQESAAMEMMQQAVLRLECTRDERLPQALESLAAMYSLVGKHEDAAGCLERAFVAWNKLPGSHSNEVNANREALEAVNQNLAISRPELFAVQPVQIWQQDSPAGDPQQTAGSAAASPVPASTGPQAVPAAKPALPSSVIVMPVPAYVPPPAPGQTQLVLTPVECAAAPPSVAPPFLPQPTPDAGALPLPVRLSPVDAGAAAEEEEEKGKLTGWNDISFDEFKVD
jgi:tetratricopeptide (TPR) repeat protein